MQPRPTAIELLAAVASVIEEQLVPALTGPAQHHARVAASLVGIVERELRLGPEADALERASLMTLLESIGAPPAGVDNASADNASADNASADAASTDSLAALRVAVAKAVRAGGADDDAAGAVAWPVLMDGVRRDLAIVKPGHDVWGGD